MHFRILIFLGIILSGCHTNPNSSPSKSASNSTQKVTAKEGKKVGGIYKWKGSLNSSIPIFMWLYVQDSVIKGQLTYLKTKKQLPITVLGTITDEGFKIQEFQKDGTVSEIPEF